MTLYDIAYAAGLTVSAPVWAARSRSRDKVLSALGQRAGYVLQRPGDNPAVLIHAVSLGEINAAAEMVRRLHAIRPDLHVVVSTTTTTGYDRGRTLYAGRPGVSLVRFPVDWSTSVSRFLDRLRPSVVALMEGELWPNFLLTCQRRKLPVVLVNGRMTPSAFKRYSSVKRVSRAMVDRLAVVAVQDQVAADRFRSLSSRPDRIHITGTMKFDTAKVDQAVPGADDLADELGLRRTGVPPVPSIGGTPMRLWVCGSTGPGEESIVLAVYRDLLRMFPDLRVAIIPRKPERFDEVATLIRSAGLTVTRRSHHRPAVAGDVILGDTMGELRKFYALADLVFVGRSLVDLGHRQHGSDMIEPAALGKPVCFGPWTHNFGDAVRAFVAADAVKVVTDGPSLAQTIAAWLHDPGSANLFGSRARAVVRDNQGATDRHVRIILDHLSSDPG